MIQEVVIVHPKNRKSRKLAQLTALVENLDQRGMLSETLVLATAEFGRTPRVNNAHDFTPVRFTLIIHRPGHEDFPVEDSFQIGEGETSIRCSVGAALRRSRP